MFTLQRCLYYVFLFFVLENYYFNHPLSGVPEKEKCTVRLKIISKVLDIGYLPVLIKKLVLTRFQRAVHSKDLSPNGESIASKTMQTHCQYTTKKKTK